MVKLDMVVLLGKENNNMYATKFFINMLNVFIQFYFINHFLGCRFLDYGAQLLNVYNNIEMGIDPMVEVFFKVTKCQFNRNGPGGDINVNIQYKMLNK